VNLRDMQRWMLACVTGRACSLAAAALVKDTPYLSAQDRLDIYARGYLARLVSQLRSEFPMLAAHMGDDVFDLFATAYIQARPPSSWSLLHLADGFADFLDDTRPPDPGAELPAALARLERAGSFRPRSTQT
jgi:acyl-homoserine lactone acylase PvdQ